MEILIVFIGTGVISVLNILAFKRFRKQLLQTQYSLSSEIAKVNFLIVSLVSAEHKKTRKNQQEIKTRLTQVRKDLNAINKLLKKHYGKK